MTTPTPGSGPGDGTSTDVVAAVLAAGADIAAQTDVTSAGARLVEAAVRLGGWAGATVAVPAPGGGRSVVASAPPGTQVVPAGAVTVEHTLRAPDGHTLGWLSAWQGPAVPPSREILAALSRCAQAALLNAGMRAAADARTATMTELYEVTKTMVDTFDLDMIFSRIAVAVHRRLGTVTVTLLEVIGERARLVRAHGRHEVVEPAQELVLGGALAAAIERLRRERTIVVDAPASQAELDVLVPGSACLLLAGYVEWGALVLVLAVGAPRRGAFDDDDRVFAAHLVDIAALAVRNARLYQATRTAAERDSLTGLRNRRVFWHDLRQRLRTASPALPVALAVLDVDDFKSVNDRFGHDVGDRALRHVAARMRQGTRATDTVYRIGGEEFAILLPATSGDGALAVLARVGRGLRHFRGPLPDLTVSAGIAVADEPSVDADALFRRADAALYASKQAGKDLVTLGQTPATEEDVPPSGEGA